MDNCKTVIEQDKIIINDDIIDQNQYVSDTSFFDYSYFFEDIRGHKYFIYKYSPLNKTISINDISQFVSFFDKIASKNASIPILLDLDQCIFCDKLVYVLLETVIYYFITTYNLNITIGGELIPENCSNGISYSSLNYGNFKLDQLYLKSSRDYLSRCNIDRIDKYTKNRMCSDELSLSRWHIVKEKNIDDCLISSDINDFFTNSPLITDKDLASKIAHTIIELKDNCSEHSNSDYIYDIDIKESIHKAEGIYQGKDYISVNVAIWDFSGCNIGSRIKEKINRIKQYQSYDGEQVLYSNKKSTFRKLMDAYDKHCHFWNNKYDFDDFCCLAAFQPGITGRESDYITGGAGLAHVLDFLLSFPDVYRCYCITGNTIITLNKDYIKKDKSGWYSFNEAEEQDFCNNIPSKACIGKSQFFYPGTAFFLHLEINK